MYNIELRELTTQYAVKTPEEIRQEDLQAIAGYRLLDDTFARSAFRRKPELAQFVLRIITQLTDLIVDPADYSTQYDAKRLVRSRSLVFDVHAGDLSGRKYDLEMEKWDASPARAEVHISAMIAEHLLEGGDFADLNETYSIFMCEHDVIGNGRAVNQFSYRNDDLFLESCDLADRIPNQSMSGRTHIIFVNGDYEDSSKEIGRLIHDFKCSSPAEMFNANLADRVRYLKEDPEGVEEVCKIMEDIRRDDERRNTMRLTVLYVRNMMQTLNLSIDKAMDAINVPQEMRSDVSQLVPSNYYRTGTKTNM